MDARLMKHILAVVTLDPGVVAGGVPVFVAQTEQEREEVAFLLGRILEAMVHDLGNGAYVLVRH
ncbi:MAG: hypothetical protein K6T75_04945 [Acetobacteraceae bacterium]|nr:hypothetical protein [Acetobacteraceae bacterium]